MPPKRKSLMERQQELLEKEGFAKPKPKPQSGNAPAPDKRRGSVGSSVSSNNSTQRHEVSNGGWGSLHKVTTKQFSAKQNLLGGRSTGFMARHEAHLQKSARSQAAAGSRVAVPMIEVECDDENEDDGDDSRTVNSAVSKAPSMAPSLHPSMAGSVRYTHAGARARAHVCTHADLWRARK